MAKSSLKTETLKSKENVPGPNITSPLEMSFNEN